VSRRSRRDEATLRTREVAARAVRRLEFFEWALLVGAVALALVGGALVAALLATPLGVPFRLLWVGASLLFFVAPGAVALRRARQEERGVRPSNLNPTDDSDV